jgi:hypothetical protein
MKTARSPNLPWLRIFLSRKGTMKVYKLKRKYRGIIAKWIVGEVDLDTHGQSQFINHECIIHSMSFGE